MWSLSDIGENLKAIFGIVFAVVLVILYWQFFLFLVILAVLLAGLGELWKRSHRLTYSVLLALISAPLFGWAIISQSTAGQFFLAGIPALASLYLLGGFLDTAKPKRRFARTLVGNLTEVAAIFTAVAGAYTAASWYLGDQLLGSVTLRDLMEFDGAMLYARVFMDELKPSTLQGVILAASFMGLLWVERYSTDRRGKTVETAWKLVQGGLKWTSRAALLTLFLASFTFLAVYGRGPASEINARLRDFKQAYTQLQGKVGQAIDHQVKRDLMAKAWAQMDAKKQRLLEESVANRKAAQTLAERYKASTVLGLYDPEIERIVARDAGSIAQEKVEAERNGAKPAPENAAPPPPKRYQDVSLETIRNAAREAQDATEVIKQEALPGPLEEMESSIKSGLMDMALEHAQEHVRFFDALNSHFPGLGEVLNSVSDAMTESFAERRRARDEAVEKAVSSPRPRLLEIERDQARAVSRRAGSSAAKSPAPGARSSPPPSQSSSLAAAEAAQIQRAESRLTRELRGIEAEELRASRTRSRDLAKQAGELQSESKLDFSDPTGWPRRLRLQPHITGAPDAHWEGPSASSKLDALKTIKMFADTQLTLELEMQLEEEVSYQEKIAIARSQYSRPDFVHPGVDPVESRGELERRRWGTALDGLDRFPVREPIRPVERPFIPRAVP